MLGFAAALLGPSSTGCIIPDKCILVITSGHDWCRVLSGAKMWPIGQPDEAVDVQRPEGGPPIGCACFNDAEHDVLEDEVPANYMATLQAKIEQAARDACDAQVPAGYDHNCYIVGPEGPQPESPYGDGPGQCVGGCAYTGDCEDPNPYECEAIVGDGDPGGPSETGGEDGPLNPVDDIFCSGTDCEIDEGFATSLWLDPSPLADEGTRLIYDPSLARFVFDAVGNDTVADQLGFRDGDVLESVNGIIIDDLDAALGVYAQSGTADALRVRVARSSRWIDFNFTFVP